MSNLLSQASLVMIPSGYKEDVVYSPVPTNGNGDLSFTRASNGTRINSAGLVEVCPWNLVQYSEDFGNGNFWGSSNESLTTNATVAPNGTTTADLLIPSAGTVDHYLLSGTVSTIVGEVVTLSLFVKKKENDYFYFGTGGASSFGSVVYRFSTNTFTVSGLSATATNFGNGWIRLSITGTTGATDLRLLFTPTDSTGSRTYNANGTDGTYIWGAQANIGSTAKPYFPTTDRLNVPRLTYQNGGGGCPSLLLEKQSTNLVKYSEQFDNTGQWNPFTSGTGSVTITANYATSPDGTQNADRLQLNGGSGFAFVGAAVTVTNGTTYTYSIWLKALSGTPNVAAIYDGSTVQTTTLTSEWVRYTFNFVGTGGSTYPRVGVWQANWGTSLNADVLAWGAQLEASSYPTSYIPTTSSSATRVADACFKTGISSLIGQTEGVVFFDIDKLIDEAKLEGVLYLSDGTSTTNVINFYFAFTNQMVCAVTESGATQAQFTIGTITTRTKIALAYKANDFALYKNGSLVGTDTSGSVPATNKLTLGATQNGSAPMTGVFNQAVLFPTRLTNAELASLTTI